MIEELAIGIPVVLALAGVSYKSYSNKQKEQDNKITGNTEACTETKVHVAQIQSDVNNIKEDIQESKDTQNRIFDSIDQIKDTLISRGPGA